MSITLEEKDILLQVRTGGEHLIGDEETFYTITVRDIEHTGGSEKQLNCAVWTCTGELSGASVGATYRGIGQVVVTCDRLCGDCNSLSVTVDNEEERIGQGETVAFPRNPLFEIANAIYPNQPLCPGDSFSIPVDIVNRGVIAGDVTLSGPGISETVTLEPDETATIEPTFEMPDVDAADITLEVTNEGGVSTDSVTGAVQTHPLALNVRPLDAPSETCVDEPIGGTVRIANNGECERTVRSVFSDSANRRSVDGPEAIPAGGVREFVYGAPMPQANIDLVAEPQVQRGDSWETIDTNADLTATVESVGPRFQVTGRNYPQFVQPGQQSEGNFTVLNTGSCAGQVAVSGTRLSRQTERLGAGESMTFTHAFDMPPAANDLTVRIDNETLERTADRFSVRVTPREAAILDTTPGGELTLFGGFGSRIAYSGLAYGSAFRGEGLERTDTVAGVTVVEFTGTVAPQGVDVDQLNFSQLSYLLVQFDTEVLIAKNGEIKGKAQSVEYNATPVPSSFYRRGREAPDATLRFNPANPIDVGASLSGVVPVPTFGLFEGGEPAPTRQGTDGAFE